MSEKVAIVTGGTGALGRHIVEKLSSSGYRVYVPTLTMDEFTDVFDRSSEDNVEIGIRKIFAFDCNALDESSVKEFVNKVAVQEKGNLGYLVNTVGGIDSAANIGELTKNSFDKMMSLNFYSAYYFSSEALQIMKKNSFGRIISIGALAGMETSPGRFAYSASKQAVINLMNTISEECKDLNIRCNTIVPGIMDTPANREWGTAEDIKKWVKPEEIAGIIHSLISDNWSQTRGSIIKVLGSY
jgi:NAD(P)-dependent dehydrogenase (short-subunit alcohol dehydrogenase family)